MFKFRYEKHSYTAKSIAAFWDRQEEAMAESPLIYLDALLDTLLKDGVSDPDVLTLKLYRMVPDLQYGTAKRLVRLKVRDSDWWSATQNVVTRDLEN